MVAGRKDVKARPNKRRDQLRDKQELMKSLPGLYKFALRHISDCSLHPLPFPFFVPRPCAATSGSDYRLLVMHRKCVYSFVRFELTASALLPKGDAHVSAGARLVQTPLLPTFPRCFHVWRYPPLFVPSPDNNLQIVRWEQHLYSSLP